MNIPAWIVAIATVFYVGLTLWIILEMRRDRKLLHKPFLDARLKDAIYPDWLLFDLKNVGRGPALHCNFICKDDGELEWKIKETSFPVSSGEVMSLRFEVSEKYQKRLGRVLWMEVHYTDIFNRNYKQRIFEGTAEAIMSAFSVAKGGSI